MIEITKTNIEKAINKARQTKPFVKVIEFRRYSVTNKITGANYTVKFTKIDDKKFAECDCKATVICYHIGASIGAHIVLAEQIHTAPA
jgi:N-acetyl-gamma-glutamylphosphate reductase